MKKLMLYFAACLALLCTALHAQDITGQWQGTLKAQKDFRVVLVVAKDNGALKGTFYYGIDHPAQPMKVSISLDGSIFKFADVTDNATYEGQLSADGNTIPGTWTDYLGTPNQLVLVRANKADAWDIPAPPAMHKLMPADADPSFVVATIKPNDSGITMMQGKTFDGRTFTARAYTLDDLIAFSYDVATKQIVGGPSWMRSERFDIHAVSDVEGQPNNEQSFDCG